MNDALQELERSTDETRAEWVAGEIERLSAALATAEATIAEAREAFAHCESYFDGEHFMSASERARMILNAHPSSGVLAEHDAKVWDEGCIAAERFHLGPKGHWEYDTERGIRTWIRYPGPVNPYHAQVIREGKTDV